MQKMQIYVIIWTQYAQICRNKYAFICSKSAKICKSMPKYAEYGLNTQKYAKKLQKHSD